jgi:hypothetical protein
MKNKRDLAGLVGGGILIVSLFMPWISAGNLSQRALDIKYGYILLLFGVVACVVAVFNIITQNKAKVYFIYPVLGILSGLVLYQNYGDLARNAQRTMNNFPFLTDFIQGFIGPGVYVGLIGCVIMFGSLFFVSE